MNLLCVGPVFGRLSNRLKLTRGRPVADAHADTGDFEIVAQGLLLLGRRAFVHAEQALVLVLGDEVCAAYVGSQHGLFDQAVRGVAGSRHDFLNAPVLVADDLRLGGFKVHRATLVTGLEQSLVHAMQV